MLSSWKCAINSILSKKVPFIHSDQCHSQQTGRVRDGGLDAGRVLGGKRREGSILGAWEPNYFAVALCLVKGNCKTDIYFRPRAQQICNAMTDCTGIWQVKSSHKEPSPLSCLFESGLEIFWKLQWVTTGLNAGKEPRRSSWYLVIRSVRSHAVLGISHDWIDQARVIPHGLAPHVCRTQVSEESHGRARQEGRRREN